MWQMVMAASSSNIGVYKYGANGVCDYELLCMGWGVIMGHTSRRLSRRRDRCEFIWFLACLGGTWGIFLLLLIESSWIKALHKRSETEREVEEAEEGSKQEQEALSISIRPASERRHTGGGMEGSWWLHARASSGCR